MPAGIATPVTLGTTYADNGTLGPFQEVDEIIFQFTGGPVAFQFGSVDPSGAVRFDNQEIIYPPGAWAFRNIKGIRFRSIPGQTAVSLQAAVAFFNDDPEPFTPGNVPGSVSLTSTLNFQHNDIFVASEPTLDFEDSGSLVWNLTDDNVNSRMKLSGAVTGFVAVHTIGAAGSTTLFDTEVTGDTNPEFALTLDGSMKWGPGNAVADTVLGRNSAGALFLLNPAGRSGLFIDYVWAGSVSGITTSAPCFQASISTDTNPRYQVNADGTINWGPGASSAFDTSLARLGANLLGTGGDFFSTGPLNNGRSTVGVFLDTAGRTLNTAAAVTNAQLAAAVVGDTFWRISLDTNGPGNMPQIIFGTGAGAGDTSWSRGTTDAPSGTAIGWHTGSRVTCTSTAGFNVISPVNNAALQTWLLSTDSQPAFKIFQQGAMVWGPGGSTAPDIELARITSAPTGTGSFLELINGDGLGYGTGCGASVTQLTSKSTAVTINAPTGKITMFASTAINGGSSVSFEVNCTQYGLDDVVIINAIGPNTGLGRYWARTVQDGVNGLPSAGHFLVEVGNEGLTEGVAVVLQYAIIKGAHS